MGIKSSCLTDKTVIEGSKGRNLADFYELGKSVGSGGFATVYLATCRTTGKTVAVKCIDKKPLFEQTITRLREEIKILRMLDHPNIIRFIDYFEDKKTCNIVTEHAGGGELFRRLVDKVCYDESEARALAKEILNGIKYCHDRNIVHRDLKPENILLAYDNEDKDAATVKIVDFGFATEFVRGVPMETRCGSYSYSAPELLIEDQPYDELVDMWSLGIVFYLLLGGYLPFEDKHWPSLMQKIINDAVVFDVEYWSNISSDAKDLIKGLLRKNPKRRLTAAQALAHPWFKDDTSTLEKHNITNSLAHLKQFNSADSVRHVLEIEAEAAAAAATAATNKPSQRSLHSLRSMRSLHSLRSLRSMHPLPMRSQTQKSLTPLSRQVSIRYPPLHPDKKVTIVFKSPPSDADCSNPTDQSQRRLPICIEAPKSVTFSDADPSCPTDNTGFDNKASAIQPCSVVTGNGCAKEGSEHTDHAAEPETEQTSAATTAAPSPAFASAPAALMTNQ